MLGGPGHRRSAPRGHRLAWRGDGGRPDRAGIQRDGLGAARSRFEPTDAESEMTQLEQRRLPTADGEHRPLSSRLLRSIGFGAVAEEAKSLLTDPVILENFLGDGWRRPSVRPGRKQREPHHYALWANRYVWALKQDPRRPIQYIVEADGAAGEDRSEKEVRGQVSRTRPRFSDTPPRTVVRAVTSPTR